MADKMVMVISFDVDENLNETRDRVTGILSDLFGKEPNLRASLHINESAQAVLAATEGRHG